MFLHMQPGFILALWSQFGQGYPSLFAYFARSTVSRTLPDIVSVSASVFCRAFQRNASGQS